MKKILLFALLFAQPVFANPNGYVLLSPKKIEIKKDKTTSFTFEVPCSSNRAEEHAILVRDFDDTGDQIVTVGLLYPAGYCMNSKTDEVNGKPQLLTIDDANEGHMISTKANVRGARLLPKTSKN